MIIHNPLSTSLIFYFIPSRRINLGATKIEIINDTKVKRETNISMAVQSSGDYLKCTVTIDSDHLFTDQNFYSLKIIDGLHISYKDKIFCTDQTVQQSTNNYYTINSGTYTTDTTYDNELILV